MKHFWLITILLMPVIVYGQGTIESTNIEFKMRKNNTDRIILNSGPDFLFPLPPIIRMNDVFGTGRILMLGNSLENLNYPEFTLTSKVEVDSTYTVFNLKNELSGGTWGLGMGSYHEQGQNLNTFDITLDNESKLSIDEEGDVYIQNFKRNPSVTFRPLLIDYSGKIIAPSTDQTHTYSIQFSEFEASEGDGSDKEIIRLGVGYGFVQHKGDITDTGELIAPIHLPNGVRIKAINVSYINEASDTSTGNRYRISVHRAPRRPNNQSQLITNWNNLPVGGQSGPNPFGALVTTFHQILFDPSIQVISLVDLYTLVVRCENCSEQYLRSIDISYSY